MKKRINICLEPEIHEKIIKYSERIFGSVNVSAMIGYMVKQFFPENEKKEKKDDPRQLKIE